MNAIGALIIAAVVIWGLWAIATVLGTALKSVGSLINELNQAVCESALKWRSSLVNRTVSKSKYTNVLHVPDFRSDYTPAEDDKELRRLILWQPNKVRPDKLTRVEYVAQLGSIKEPSGVYSAVMDLQELGFLQNPSINALDDFFASFKRCGRYPVPRPSSLAAPAKPPNWSYWNEEIPAPTLTLPYHVGRFQFVNRLIDAGYKKKRKHYADLVEDRKNLIDKIRARNRAVRSAVEMTETKGRAEAESRVAASAALMATYEKDSTAYLQAAIAELTKFSNAAHCL